MSVKSSQELKQLKTRSEKLKCELKFISEEQKELGSKYKNVRDKLNSVEKQFLSSAHGPSGTTWIPVSASHWKLYSEKPSDAKVTKF